MKDDQRTTLDSKAVKRAARCLRRKESHGIAILDNGTSILYDAGMAKKRAKTMTDQIRQAIDDSGLTRYRIAQGTGIDESALAKFYNKHRGLSLDNLDQLTLYLGIAFTATMDITTQETTAMAKKKRKTPAQRAVVTKENKPGTLQNVDAALLRARGWLDREPPNIKQVRREINRARNVLRKACELPPVK